MAIYHFSIKSDKKRNGERKSAAVNLDRIFRQGQFESKTGICLCRCHHLPSWANDNPKNFFKAADKYEGKNRRRYVEIELSLPNELTSVDDYKKIIDKFIDLHLKDHYFAYAIHEKFGDIEKTIRHPYAQIMFSERMIDDVEKVQERPPQFFFKRAFSKKGNETEPSFEEKFLHGAPKNRKWNCNPYHSNLFIIQMRSDFAKIQNEVLAEKGFDVRVDHRSLKDQRDDAIRNGDKFLAELLNRKAEKFSNLSNVPVEEKNKRIANITFQRLSRRHHIESVKHNFSQKIGSDQNGKLSFQD